MRIIGLGLVVFVAASAAPVEPLGAASRQQLLWEIGNRTNIWWASADDIALSAIPSSSKTIVGLKANWKESLRAAVARGEVSEFVPEVGGALSMPEEFDSAAAWPQCAKAILDIRDQSNCGCCWAFAAAEAASDRMCIATNGTLLLPLSAEDICFCASRDGCDGGMVDVPWIYVKRHGAVTGGQYHGTGPFGKGMCSDFALPHCHHHGPQGEDPYPAEGAPGCPSASSPTCPKRCDGDAAPGHADFDDDKYTFEGRVETARGENHIQQMIMRGGPVSASFTVYEDFENYVGGIYHHVAGGMAGGHAVKMVGWGVDGGVKYWKIANSWNPHWGEEGFFRIRRGSNEGDIEDMVVAASHDASWGKKNPRAAHLDVLVV